MDLSSLSGMKPQGLLAKHVPESCPGMGGSCPCPRHRHSAGTPRPLLAPAAALTGTSPPEAQTPGSSVSCLLPPGATERGRVPGSQAPALGTAPCLFSRCHLPTLSCQADRPPNTELPENALLSRDFGHIPFIRLMSSPQTLILFH